MRIDKKNFKKPQFYISNRRILIELLNLNKNVCYKIDDGRLIAHTQKNFSLKFDLIDTRYMCYFIDIS